MKEANKEAVSGDLECRKASGTKRGVASRRLAVEVLIKVTEGAYVNLALKHAFAKKKISERDRAFVTALVQGVLRERDFIDDRLAEVSKQPLTKMPPPLLNLLRLSIFQIERMDDIPPSCVVACANELARAMGHVGHVRFANGVLRTYLQKQSQSSCDASREIRLDSALDLARHFSMPVWLIEKWLKVWGQEETLLLLKYCQSLPELTLRVCQRAMSTQGLQAILASKGLRARQGELVDSCLIVEDRGSLSGPVEKLPGFAEGLFVVQDEAAAFASKVVDPKSGELVIDLCAAPGGKSVHLAEMMNGKGRLIAVDKSLARLELLKKTRQRLGLTNIEVVALDGQAYVADKQADRVLVDAPCTGTGVINRRSDIRFKRQLPDLGHLQVLQRNLLSKASTLVKPGGILVYSTCSLEMEENMENISWFLANHKDFCTDSLAPFVSSSLLDRWCQVDPLVRGDLESGHLQLMPSRHGLSGFFVCRMRRLDENMVVKEKVSP